MKQNFLTAAVVAIAGLFAAPAFAQTASCNATCNAPKCENKEQCEKRECKKPCRNEQCTKTECSKDRLPSPFDGIELSDSQKKQFEALNAEQAAKAKQNKEQAKEDRKKASADRKACKQQCRNEYLAKVKGILTPEQYVKYLENCYINSGRPDGGRQIKQRANGPVRKDVRNFERRK